MKLLFSYFLILLFFTSGYAQGTGNQIDSPDVTSKLLPDLKTLDAQTLADTMAHLANKFYDYDPIVAENLIDSAESYLDPYNDLAPMARLFSTRGTFSARKGQYLEAIRQFQQSLWYYYKIDTSLIQNGYLNIEIGNLFYRLEYFKDAVQFYEKAQSIFELHKTRDGHFGLTVSLNNIGLCFYKSKRYDLAEKYFLEALALRKVKLENDVIAHSYGYLIRVYEANGDFAKADSLLEDGLQNLDLDSNSVWFKSLYYLKGKKCQRHLKYAEAESFYKYLLSTELESNGEIDLELSIIESMVEMYMAQKQRAKAKSFALEGFTLTMTKHNYNQAIVFQNFLKQIAINEGDLKTALAISDKVLALTDSLNQAHDGIVQELAFVQNSIANARNENEILHLRSENYSETITKQGWLITIISIAIIILLSLFYFISKLNRKLRKNEASQRELNQRVLAVINNTDSLIVSINEFGEIRLINQAAIEYFEKWIEQSISAGDNLIDKITDPEKRKMWTQWISKSQQVSSWKEVSQISIKDKTLYVLENFSAITRENGMYAGMVMVGNDITKEHEFNVEIAKQRDSLEKSDEAKERMLSILAHDLKDAIYSANSLTKLVAEEPENFKHDEMIQLFGLMSQNFSRTKSLLDGLLEWMRTQTAGLKANPEGFCIGGLTDQIIDSTQSKWREKRVVVKNNIEEQVEVFADKEMIKTVLRNLISNSIKYTQPGSGLIEIKALQNGSSVSIIIEDNGHGISKENQEKLFTQPGRFSTVGTSDEQGTGFGLSLCRELLKLNHSKLELKSSENSGSEFYFSLPYVNKKDSAN